MKPFAVDSFKEYRLIFGLKAWENQLGFMVKQAEMDTNKYLCDLWLIKEGKEIPLTQRGNLSRFWWRSKDEIVFTQQDDGENQTALYKIAANGPGEACIWQTLPFSIEELVFVDENTFVFLTLQSPRAKAEQEAEKQDPAKKKAGDCTVLTRLPFWENGGGFTGEPGYGIYLWNQGEVKELAGGQGTAGQLRLSPGKEWLFYCCQPDQRIQPLYDRLMRLPLAHGGEAEDVSLGEHFWHYSYIPFSEKGVLVFGSDLKSFGMNQNGGFYRLELDTKQVKALYEKGEYSYEDMVATDVKAGAGQRMQLADDGKTVYWVTTLGAASHLMQIDCETGQINQLTHQPGAVHEFTLWQGRPVFAGLRQLEGVELYELKNGVEVPASQLNCAVGQTFARVPLERLVFTSRGGGSIEGWVQKPLGWEPGRQYPAILYIHGGPKMAFAPVVFHELQYLSAKGYGVFFCNPTGSDGGGDKFADIRGGYGGVDYQDLMDFTDLVLEQNPWIDGQRLGVAGGSYGGFMTNWMIGQTRRFKAAVSQRGIANWTTMALTTDIGYFFVPDQIGAEILEDRDILWDHSPLKYAPQVKTPTLFVHSDEDYRCWMVEALQMYTALQLAGVETKMCLFHKENHELSRSGKPQNRVRRLQEITDWFDHYLG